MSKNWITRCFPPSSYLFLVSFSMFLSIEANKSGFTLDLIHRDSPESPFYNPSITHFQRSQNAFQRSLQRAGQFYSSSVIPNSGEYLMRISYGTPPFETLALVDTGSVITWVQCLPCIDCYMEKYQPFNPANSSTFKLVPCTSKTCHSFYSNYNTCDSSTTRINPCAYGILYKDSSYSKGDLAIDTITLDPYGEKRSFKNFVFGCGHKNVGKTYPYKGTGIVGLGYGRFSLIHQLNSSTLGKFSYCLGPSFGDSKPGKISFGNHALVSDDDDDDVVSTPLYSDAPFYKIILEGISVANQTFQFPNYPSSNASQQGNIIIDSGTTITFLPADLYQQLREAIIRETGKETVPDPSRFFDLCYSSVNEADVPPVTVHLRGADLKLKPFNIFVTSSEASVCLAFVPSTDFPVFGNVAQMNVKVGYDLENMIISFKPTDCSL